MEEEITISELIQSIHNLILPVRESLGSKAGTRQHIIGTTMDKPFSIIVSLVVNNPILEDESGIDICFSMQNTSHHDLQQKISQDFYFLIGGVSYSTGETVWYYEEITILKIDPHKMLAIRRYVETVLASISSSIEQLEIRMRALL